MRAILDPYLTAAFKAEEMGPDEATALLARRARAEISDLFDPLGRVLPPTEWPHHVRAAVKTFKAGNGTVHIAMHDPQRPTEKILELTGRSKGVGEGLSELAEALMEDLNRRKAP